jgi:hypothetical protein
MKFKNFFQNFLSKKEIKPTPDIIYFTIRYTTNNDIKLIKFANEIEKSKIWCVRVESSTQFNSNCINIKVNSKDKFILNQCYKTIYGCDLIEFSEKEKNSMKQQIRKQKLEKINESKDT